MTNEQKNPIEELADQVIPHMVRLREGWGHTESGAPIWSSLKAKLVQDCIPSLLRMFPRFWKLPLPARLALVDMIATLGTHEMCLLVRLCEAVEEQDFAECARQCARFGASPARDKWTRECFEAAEAEVRARGRAAGVAS